jgi:hypothetical protein
MVSTVLRVVSESDAVTVKVLPSNTKRKLSKIGSELLEPITL